MAHRLRLLELLARPDAAPARVDRGAGVLRGVKLIGHKSKNGRRYTREALARARRLYEGAPVYCNHPDRPGDERKVEDRVGMVQNVRLTESGLYGDIVLLKSHPMAERLYEIAEDPRKHGWLGASHNAEGQVDYEGGEAVVSHIDSVRSVDLVSEPASTTSLFESSRRGRGMKRTLREWFDRTKLLRPARQKITRLMESGYMDPEQVMEADEVPADVEASAGASPTSDPADMDPEAALRQGFRSACMAVIDDTTMTAKDKVQRLKRLLTVAEELLASGQEIPEEVEPEPGAEGADALAEGVGCGGGEDKEKVMESKRAGRLAYLEAERAARELCDREGVRATAVLLESLARLDTEAKRLALIEEFKPARKARTAPAFGPAAPRPADEPKDAKGWAERLTGVRIAGE